MPGSAFKAVTICQSVDGRDCAHNQSQNVPTLVIDGANEYLSVQQILQRVVLEGATYAGRN